MNDGWDDEDGWDDDEDLNIDDLNDPAEDGDGWGDDDNLFDGVDGNDDATSSPPPPPPPLQPEPQPQQPQQSTIVEDGWGDDESDDLNFDDDADDANVDAVDYGVNLQQSNNNNSDDGGGWDDDDDLFFGDDNDDDIDHHQQQQQPPPPPPPSNHHPRRQELLQELELYMNSLRHNGGMLSSINAVLEYEYNTQQKAVELVEYYLSRVNLAEYTRTKELGRMEYQVVLPNGDVVFDKDVIGSNYLPDESIISRCSNQSLLADLLQVITGRDLLVRPQYHATCIARSCKFTIHLDDDMVNCICHLHLSLPTASGQRLDVADIHVSIVFAPNQPIIEYRVHSIKNLLLPTTTTPEQGVSSSSLIGTVDFLMEFGDVGPEFEQDNDGGGGDADIYRDRFLEQSQKFFTNSTMGMKSALQEMESVVNIQQKINLVKQFIPDTDHLQLLDAVEREEMELIANATRQQQQQQQQQDAQSMPPQPTQQQKGRDEEANRPKSILGGLVRSGWSKLASSVAMPDDDDPAIYGQVFQQQRSPQPNYQGFPRPPPPPTLRSMSSSTEQQQQEHFGEAKEIPTLYKEEGQKEVDLSQGFPRPQQQPPPPQPPKQEVPTLYRKEEPKEVDLSQGFPRPQQQQPPPQLPKNNIPKLYRKEEPKEVDLSQGFPRPQQTPPRPSQSPGSEAQSKPTNLSFDSHDSSSSKQNVFESSKQISSDMDIALKSDPKPMLGGEQPTRQEQKSQSDVLYNPEDDIIPTRKRWVNPRPHRPYLVM